VNGSVAIEEVGTDGVVGAPDESEDEPGAVSDGFAELLEPPQAVTTTDAPRAKNIRREIGEVISRVWQSTNEHNQSSDLSTLMAVVVMVGGMKRRRNVVFGSLLAMVSGACGSSAAGDPAPALHSSTTTSPITSTFDSENISSSSLPWSPTDTKDTVALSFDALMARRIECGRRPKECDISSLAVSDSPLFTRLTSLMEQRIRAGITASRRGSLRYRIDDVVMSGVSRATVTTCLTDDTVLMSAGAIFNDSRYSAFTVWTMQRDSSRWLWVDDHVVDWRTGEDLCAFDG